MAQVLRMPLFVLKAVLPGLKEFIKRALSHAQILENCTHLFSLSTLRLQVT